MTVKALDHINIQTADLAATVRFFADALDLTEGDPPPGLDPARIRWMFDAAGRALFHLTAVGALDGVAAVAAGQGSGAVHHVALDCSDHAAMLARLATLGLAHRCNDVPSIGLAQIFVSDPNGVLIELNFREGFR